MDFNKLIKIMTKIFENFFIGREKEFKDIKLAIQDDLNKLITIQGRRGNGKTTLVECFLDFYKKDYEIIKINGQKGVSNLVQSKNFLLKFKNILSLNNNNEIKKALDNKWDGVFDLLSEKINYKKEKKLIIFIDEFPWLHTKKSNFVQAFSSFWNKVQNGKNLYFILTGSAVAWMNKNVINTNGGLYARIHTIIDLKPFSFLETVDFLKMKNKFYNIDEMLSYYFMTGGVPRYLTKILTELSVEENAKKLFNSNFESEYDKLFTSSFESNLGLHKKIVNLFKHKRSYKKSELEKFNLCSKRNLLNIIDDLVCSGILKEIKDYNKKTSKKYINDNYFTLTDLFCYSYLKYSENSKVKSIIDGYSFEILTLNNIDLILKEIGRSGVSSYNFSWQNDKAQIDLINLANDNVCHIIECKNYNKEFIITKEFENNLNNKIEEIEKILPKKSQLKLVIFTVHGTKKHSTVPFINVNLSEIVKRYLILKNL